MLAIPTSNAMIMGPAKMMGLANVILDSTTTTVQVNLQRPFEIETGVCCWFFVRLYHCATIMIENNSTNISTKY